MKRLLLVLLTSLAINNVSFDKASAKPIIQPINFASASIADSHMIPTSRPVVARSNEQGFFSKISGKIAQINGKVAQFGKSVSNFVSNG